MNLVQLVSTIFAVTIFVSLVNIGLASRPREGYRLAERFDKGGRAVLAMFVVVPVVVMLLCYFMPMPPAAEAALIALSVAPMLPTLPNDLDKLNVDRRYSIGLEVVSVFVALVAAPIAFWIVSRITRIAIEIETWPLLEALAKGVLLPLVIGFVARMLAPGLAARLVDPINKITGVVLLVCVLVLLWGARGLIAAQFEWSILFGVVALIVTGLVAGHFLAGPDRAERAGLALTSASRHIGFAIAVGTAVAPKAVPAVLGTVLLYFLLRGLVVLPYQRHMRRAAA